MEISQKQYKHCNLVKITGRVDSLTAPILAEALKSIMEFGKYKIVIDCTGLEFISSAGLMGSGKYPKILQTLQSWGSHSCWSC